MKRNLFVLALAMLTAIGALYTSGPVEAQVAGASTTVDATATATATDSTRIAMGWSVKKTLLGKSVYNDAGQKVGKVEDLIISPDKNVSLVIVGAGGFVGIGRHDVAIPVTQIQDKAGKLVLPGSTKDTIKAMPEFTYATDNSRRDQFVEAADKDIAKGKAKLGELEKKAAAASADAKARIQVQVTSLQGDVKTAEAKLTELKQASAARWKEFEASVSAATAHLRKTIDTSTG